MGNGKGSGKDLFLIDTRCQLNKTIPKLFEDNGYDVKVGLTLNSSKWIYAVNVHYVKNY